MAKKRSTGLSFEQVEAAFTHGNLAPLYLLYGEETFLLDEAQRLLVESAITEADRAFNYDLVYGAETDAANVLALCSSFPVMAERRVVVVRDFDKLKDNRRFKAYAEQPNPQATVLLICGSKPNMSAHPYRALKQHAAWGEFKTLYANQMPSWVQRRAERMGYRLDARATQMLAEYVGTDLRAAISEIEKLATYAGGRKELTAEDVIAASGQTRDVNVFELQKALGEGRHTDAQTIAERLLQQAGNSRGEALKIVAVLTSYFTKLAKLSVCRARSMSERDMAQRAGVSPFFLKEYLHSLRLYDRRALDGALAALLAADFELKGGAERDDRLIMLLLLSRLLPQRLRAHARAA
jgi:DNA polymerase-3 subunit delta